ncbi:MAG TPA: hypothetical protein VI911_11315 [Patescibacteria group bacterium]|nr:hypothetical protein [Patescibacteria group bacterium]
MKNKPLLQNNDYGCGVFAIMNAINKVSKRQLTLEDIPRWEKILKTDKEYGTLRTDLMLKCLRKHFYATMSKKFSKKKMDNWLDRGNQAIILYPYEGKYELHYSNIFYRFKDGYEGVNFWIKNNKWARSSKTNERCIKWFYQEGTEIFYLRERK